MAMENDVLTRELNAYIRKNLRPEGVKLQDILDINIRHATAPGLGGAKWALDFLLKNLELTFSEKLLELIEAKGRKASEIYVKAGITKTHFSKIKADKDYHPTKETALAFVMALHLNMEAAMDLLKRAGYALSQSSKSDIIVAYFLEHGIYKLDTVNEALYSFGCKPLSNWRATK